MSRLTSNISNLFSPNRSGTPPHGNEEEMSESNQEPQPDLDQGSVPEGLADLQEELIITLNFEKVH